MQTSIKIDISLKTMLLALGFIVMVVVAWKVQIIFFMLFVAFILNSTLRPYVDRLEEYRIPRLLSVTVIYLVLITVITLATSTIIVQMSKQLNDLNESLPVIVENIGTVLSDVAESSAGVLNSVVPGRDVISGEDIRAQVTDYFKSGNFEVQSVFSSAVSFINNAILFLFSALTVMMMSIYMLSSKNDIYAGIISVLPEERQQKYTNLIKKIELNLGYWLRGQLVLMLAVGTATWVGLTVPGFFFESYQLDKFALPMAFLAAFLEAVPNLGPIITAVIGFVIALGSSPLNPLAPALYVVALFTFIQQSEGNFLTPLIMKRAVGLDPVVTIVAIIAAFILFSFVGALLAIPFVAVVQIIVQDRIEEAREQRALNQQAS